MAVVHEAPEAPELMSDLADETAVLQSRTAGMAGFASDAATSRSVLEMRIIEASLRCFVRWGVAKTTVDDISREAGVSRATVYRAFPAGRDSILDAVYDVERSKFFLELGAVLSGAGSVEELLARGMEAAWKRLAADEALAFLIEHEPEIILRNLAFEGLERLISVCCEVLTPFLAEWLEPRDARRVAEWATRVVVSYAIAPPDWVSVEEGTDLGPGWWSGELASVMVETFFRPVNAMSRSITNP